MVSATIDHMISITIFLAALLLFISMFSQTNETAIIYQQHRAIATKCSDLLDDILLNPGSPVTWGQESTYPKGFGLQDPEFTQYQLSTFSLMRLSSSTGSTVTYGKTGQDVTYKSVTDGFGNSLIMPQSELVNYSSALNLLGINNTYGFQLSLTPILDVAVSENHAANPLSLTVNASGNGFPLADAAISYCLLEVSLPSSESEYPSYTLQNGTANADDTGACVVQFPDVTGANQVYAFIAYVHLDGLVGIGTYQRESSADQSVVPIVDDASQQGILLAHSFDINDSNAVASSLKYNATFVVSTEDFNLREMPIYSTNTTGVVTSGFGNPYINVTIPTYTPGILIVPYQQVDNPALGGVVMMPWGISSLGFPVTFGGDPRLQEWVATDLRQVTINHVTYQAKLSLWSSTVLQGIM